MNNETLMQQRKQENNKQQNAKNETNVLLCSNLNRLNTCFFYVLYYFYIENNTI